MTRRGVVLVWWCALAACGRVEQAVDGGPCFVVEPTTEFDFGEVESGPFSFPASRSFNLRNPTDTVRFITASPAPTPFRVFPGTSRLVAGARETWAVEFAPGDALLHFGEVVLSDTEGCEVPLSLRGLGAGSLSAPTSLDFGFVAAGSEKTLELVLINTQRSPVNLEGVELASPDGAFRLEGEVSSVPASGSARLRLTAAPTLPTHSSASVTVRSRFGLLITTLTVVGGRPSAEVSPRGLRARTSPSVFVERSVMLRNTAPPGGDGSAVLQLVPPFVTARAFDGGVVGGFSLRPQASLSGLRGGEAGEVVVNFVPPATVGPAGGMISVFTNDPLQAAIDVSFEVEVTPLETCELGVSPQPLELISQGDGGSAGVLRFDALDGGACVVDDVRLITGSAPGVRVLGDAGVQRVVPFTLEVVGPTPRSRSRVGAVQLHVLQLGERVRYVDVYASP